MSGAPGLLSAFLLIPLSGALLVGGTYAAGSRYGARVGLASALLTASSPVFLYQVVQRTSDVPAAALWMLAVAAVTGTRARGAALGGLAAAAAVLVQPVLLPLAVPLVLFLLWRPERTWRSRVRTAAVFALAAASGAVAVLLRQDAGYGSPVIAGYGEAHTPVWIIAAAAPALLPGALTGLLVALVVVNAAVYLPYVVFEDWSRLRYLLPAIPLVLILMIASVDALCRRIAPWTARPVVALVALALAVLAVREAHERGALRW